MIHTLRTSSFVFVALAAVTAGARAQAAGNVHDHAGMKMRADSGLTALLTGPFGTREAHGTATVQGTAVRVTWVGDQPGSSRPWHVHRGTCTRDQGIVGAADAYAPLRIDATGHATGMAALRTPLAAGADYFIAVHESTAGTAAGTTAGSVACGPLSNGEMTRPANEPAMDPMDPMDHSTMDHSTMKRATPDDSATPTSGATTVGLAGMADTRLTSILERMLADPVIRERVRTDPVLQRMLAQRPELEMAPDGDSADTSHDDMAMPITTAPAKSAKAPAKRPVAPKSTAKPRTKPATKGVPKAAPAARKDSMPGMDHSKMPMKKKP